MATNKFLPFAVGDDANVMSDDDYANALAANGSFQKGVTTGQASAKQANKTWRQATLMAAAIAQIISDSGSDINDSFSQEEIASLLRNALLSGYIPTTGGTAAWLNVTASLNAGLGGPWRGDTAVGGFRYTYGVTIGNPGNSANGAFSANICITDVIGDANNDRSGIRIRGLNYNGDPFEYYFAWNGKVTTPSGALASQSALSAEITRASTAESNLQSAKVNRNGDDGISGSFNVGNVLTVGSSFSANAGSGYGFSYRRTTALTGAYDWFSDYGSIKAAILRLMTDGSLNILGSGHFQENGVRVSLIETLIATAAGSVRFTGGFQLVWDTVTIPARTDTSASDSFTATFAKAFTSACWGIVGFDTAQGCHVVSGVANNNNNATLWSYNHGDGNTVTTTKYIAWGT